MKQTLKDLLTKSKKRAEVSYTGKNKRTKFDETFGKDKIELIHTALGSDENRKLIFQKLAK